MNLDVRSSERILSDAPLIGYDDAFKTKALKSFDMVRALYFTRKEPIVIVLVLFYL